MRLEPRPALVWGSSSRVAIAATTAASAPVGGSRVTGAGEKGGGESGLSGVEIGPAPGMVPDPE